MNSTKRTGHRHIAAIVVLLLACLGTGIPASRAAIVRLDFSGTVTEPDADVPAFGMGDPVSGTLFIDTTTPNVRPWDPTYAFYKHAVVGGHISLSGYDATVPVTVPDRAITGVHVTNNDQGYGDTYGVTTGVLSPDFGGFQQAFFRILSEPIYPSPPIDVWDTVSIPTSTAEIAVFPGVVWWLDEFYSTSSGLQYTAWVRGEVSNITLRAVPLPSAGTLLLGAVGLLRSRSSRRRRG